MGRKPEVRDRPRFFDSEKVDVVKARASIGSLTGATLSALIFKTGAKRETMRKHFVTLVVCGLIAASADQASAQVGSAWADRAYFTLNWATESGSTDLNGSTAFPLYEETGTFETTGSAGNGPMLDFSAGARVWRNFSVGLAFHRLVSKTDVDLTGSVPHPLFFNRPRPVSQELTGFERHEHAVHLQFGYMIPVNEKLDVHVYAGPSFFNVSQDFLASVAIGESGFPFGSIVTQPVVQRFKDSPTGGHIGADVSYKLWTMNKLKLGAGGFLRYASASTTFEMLDTDIDSDVGGFQAGVGLRVRF